jgi:N-methylhydantoinase A
MSDRCFLGADIGGTFTDIVLTHEDGRMHVVKQLSTPSVPEQSVLEGISRILQEAKIEPGSVSRVVHGTTLATNAVIERKGARVAFVTTEGFGDLMRIGREARVEDDRYDLFFEPSAPPLPRNAIFEVRERIGAQGQVFVEFDEAAAHEVAHAVATFQPEAVALCFLHSYANPAHEERMQAILSSVMPETRIVASSRVHPEAREFDRASTTLYTAEVAPLMARYLAKLSAGLLALGIDAPLHIMESSGGVMAAEVAAERAVATLESGGAAGVMAAARFAGPCKAPRIISFDMGGTTAKAGVIHDGKPKVVRELHVGGRGSFGGRRAGTGMPIKTPTIDLAEVGAGGGSIAWLDPEGILRVGPRSAGAVPGPACYALGGRSPTVTDANLVLGYLTPERFAGGSMPLDPRAAHEAIEREIAAPLGTSVVRAAWAIHDVANANMASAIHVVTVQRGLDPRDHLLIAFGGAGPMHVVGVARRFGIERVMVPAEAGVASAIGMQATDLTAEHGLTHLVSAGGFAAAEAEEIFQRVERIAREKMGLHEGPGESETGVAVERSIDARFVGQAHELSIRLANMGELERVPDVFRARYRELYGVESLGEVEYAAFRVRLQISTDRPRLVEMRGTAQEPSGQKTRSAWFGPDEAVTTRSLTRAELGVARSVAGPAIIEGPVDTLVVPPGWSATLDSAGGILVGLEGA